MTFRDLTPEQLKAGAKQCRKDRNAWLRKTNVPSDMNALWNAAYNAGFKAGLAIERPPFISNKP